MKVLFKIILLLIGGILLSVSFSRAGQEAYLSESPNGHYRVLVEQVLDRRVENNIFFRYPIIVENTKDTDRRFETVDGGPRLIHQTDKKTFSIVWDDGNPPRLQSVWFDWAPDSLKFFMHLEVLEGTWRTYYVDINKGTSKDVTADFEANLVDRVESHHWDCEKPTFKLVKWIQPDLAFFKLTSSCGKNTEKENEARFNDADSVLFDTDQAQVVSHCLNCKDEKSAKKFNEYYVDSIPTPTPTVEETPNAE